MGDLRFVISGLKAKRRRTVSLMALVAATAFVITGGALLGVSLQGGIRSLSARLGADAMFVPISSVQDVEGALLRGSPSTFYLSGDAADVLSQLPGVERSSPQLFIATFNSSHCAFPVQVIGYDPVTDFVVAPWLSEKLPGGPADGEVVVGSSVNRYPGQDMYAFGDHYIVAARLDKTGMGFDTTIFANMETARKMLADYRTFPEAEEIPNDESIVSAITVDLENGVDAEAFRREVQIDYKEYRVGVVLSQALIESVSKNLGLTLTILVTLLAAFWGLAVVVLAVVFSIALNERKREFGTLRAIGATRRKLAEIILLESTLIGTIGAAAGIGLVSLVVFPFARLIESRVSASLLFPTPLATVLIFLSGFVASAAMGPLASLRLATLIGRSDVHTILQEGA